MDEQPLTKKDVERMIQDGIRQYMTNKQYTYSKIPAHTHTGIDSPKITAVDLATEVPIRLGLGGIVSTANYDDANPGDANEQLQTTIVAGRDIFNEVIGTTSDNLILNLLHQPNNTSKQSFITAYRPPLYQSNPGMTITTTATGNTLAIDDFTFDTNELTGCLININDSTGAFKETQTIASNTANDITISGTWIYTTVGGTFFIYVPVYLGSADEIWQRFYVQETSSGGIRFGPGPTGGGQNCLLYSDGSNLFWKYKTGVAIGDSSSQFDITNTSGTTYKYLWDGTGSDPGISTATLWSGAIVTIAAENFNAANNGTFRVTGVGSNFFTVTNAAGVAENNKTIGTGSITIDSVKLN